MDKPQKLVLASNNAGKLREFQQLLSTCGYAVVSQGELSIQAAEETGLTFVENAILKARHAAQSSDLPALADDSGLEVDALKGAPGIYSARFAGPGAADFDNNQKLLNALAGLPEQERSARYQCVLVFMRHAQDPTPIICQAAWEGHILPAPRGSGGFGYDPLFWPKDGQCSAAELGKEQKNRISHRGRAMQQMLTALAELRR